MIEIWHALIKPIFAFSCANIEIWQIYFIGIDQWKVLAHHVPKWHCILFQSSAPCAFQVNLINTIRFSDDDRQIAIRSDTFSLLWVFGRWRGEGFEKKSVNLFWVPNEHRVIFTQALCTTGRSRTKILWVTVTHN